MMTQLAFSEYNLLGNVLILIHTTQHLPGLLLFVSVGWLVVLVFYGPSTYFRSSRARSVNLATLFLLFLTQYRRNFCMTKSQRKNVLPDARFEPTTVRIPGGRSSDRATAPGCLCL